MECSILCPLIATWSLAIAFYYDFMSREDNPRDDHDHIQGERVTNGKAVHIFFSWDLIAFPVFEYVFKCKTKSATSEPNV